MNEKTKGLLFGVAILVCVAVFTGMIEELLTPTRLRFICVVGVLYYVTKTGKINTLMDKLKGLNPLFWVCLCGCIYFFFLR